MYHIVEHSVFHPKRVCAAIPEIFQRQGEISVVLFCVIINGVD